PPPPVSTHVPYPTLFRSHVDLQRRNDQPRHRERLVARLAHGHEFIFRDAVADVDVVIALVADGCLPLDVASVGTVVMAHEQPRLDRKSTRLNSSHVKISY